MPSSAMITARALGAMPALIARECGERGLQLAFERSDLPLRLLDSPDCFIPQLALSRFIAAGGRLLGERNIGLLFAPHLTVADYGLWGDYVLSAPTLGDSLDRAVRAIPYHASGDQLAVADDGNHARFIYRFASSGSSGYENVAYCAAGVMLSVARAYLGASWKPEWLEFDIPARRETDAVEDAFGCAVRLGGAAISVVIPRDTLGEERLAPPARPSVTFADVVRTRRGGPPTTVSECVTDLIRLQLMDGEISLDGAARSLGMGSRTLQRELERSGTSFRALANASRTERAKELLRERDATVTSVAFELGYSSPAHFARAFAKLTGLQPSKYRSL